MDLPDQVFDAEHKNVLAIIVVSFTAVMPQRNTYLLQIADEYEQPDLSLEQAATRVW